MLGRKPAAAAAAAAVMLFFKLDLHIWRVTNAWWGWWISSGTAVGSLFPD
jgi:hypothetical protein